MDHRTQMLGRPPLGWRGVVGWAGVAIAGFHLAFLVSGWFIAAFLFAVFQLAQVSRGRDAFRIGMVVGWLCYGPQLPFFWTIFKVGAVALWSVLAFWLALYLVLQRLALIRFGAAAGAILAPVLWMGIEFFRSELYYLRFTWLTPGFALATDSDAVRGLGGGYGVGFWVMAAVAITLLLWRIGRRHKLSAIVMLFVGTIAASLILPMFAQVGGGPPPKTIACAGLQIFQPPSSELLRHFDKLVETHPETELIVLGEYAFDGPVPDKVREWCAKNRRFLVAGGKDELAGNKFYDTAFVIDTNGSVAFKQAKTVPVQFLNDGLPASHQRVWESPWGRIGLGICYDLSYARVIDELIRQGAQAIVIPTMDMDEWGDYQQRLHARVAPLRSAEYRVSVLRVCSEGISQLVNRRLRGGTIPRGEGQMLFGKLTLRRSVSAKDLPFDRFLAPVCTAATGALAVWFLVGSWRDRRAGKIKTA
ncbi:MAG TPA: nitrilase-related carbon-nitrogen hydrolase [Verrucomicrobiae bacterium]